MQITAEMLLEAFRQTQREILERPEVPGRYQVRWERMAELLNEKLQQEQDLKELVLDLLGLAESARAHFGHYEPEWERYSQELHEKAKRFFPAD